IHINTLPFSGTVAFISLPSALNHSFPEPSSSAQEPPRVLFQFFGNQMLFRVPKLNKTIQCVYWNFNKNNGHGGWDGDGCRTRNTTVDYTTCLCDHLTHFGVLLVCVWTSPRSHNAVPIPHIMKYHVLLVLQ
ncbi:hypothetical protein CRUP_004229, partial [Coryphaenoides rupestris]